MLRAAEADFAIGPLFLQVILLLLPSELILVTSIYSQITKILTELLWHGHDFF